MYRKVSRYQATTDIIDEYEKQIKTKSYKEQNKYMKKIIKHIKDIINEKKVIILEVE